MDSTLRKNINVAELVQNIRDQIAQRALTANHPARGKREDSAPPLPLPPISGVVTLSGDIESFRLKIDAGEPIPASTSLRNRLSSFVKRRLYRLLWWRGTQIAELAALLARQNQEHMTIVQAIYGLIQEHDGRLRGSRDIVSEMQQHIARLEYSKANRNESTAFSKHYEALLAAKASDLDVASLTEQLMTLQKGAAEQQDAYQRQTERQKHIQGQQDLHAQYLDKLEKGLSGLTILLEEKVRDLPAFVDQLKAIGEAKADRNDLRAVEARLQGCETSRVEPGEIANLHESISIAGRQIDVLRLDLQDFHRRLGVVIEQARKRMPEPFTSEEIQELTVKGQASLDSLYLAFEDRFRGSFNDVRSGMRVYLPTIREALQRTGDAPVLDVACGRGEWLELLREEGIAAHGVDLNGSAIDLCREQELNVKQGDAFEYLRKQPKNSFAALTSFHFIEHLPYQSWIALIDEALRVLRPGGVAIFETPNARNILTTGGDFYRDPTHNRPVFPETLEAIAELRGFFDSKVYFFSADRSELMPLSQYSFDRLEDYVSVSRDTAWIGIKS